MPCPVIDGDEYGRGINAERFVVTLAGVHVESFDFVTAVLLWGFDVPPGTLAAANFLMAHVLLARIVFNLNLFLLTYAVASLVTLLVGLSLGLMFLNQLALSYLPGYSTTVSRIVLVLIAALILFSGWRYAVSLLGATYVRGRQRAR